MMMQTIQCIECEEGKRIWEGESAYTGTDRLELYKKYGFDKKRGRTINHLVNPRKEPWRMGFLW